MAKLMPEAPGMRAARGNSSNRRRLPTSTALRVTVRTNLLPYMLKAPAPATNP